MPRSPVKSFDKAAAFLAAESSDWVTSHTLFADDGMHLIGEESYIWAIERAMMPRDQIPKVPTCWPSCPSREPMSWRLT